LVKRTRAILRSAEFGFFGVTVATRVQTPRRCGAATAFLRPCEDLSPGVVVFFLALRFFALLFLVLLFFALLLFGVLVEGAWP
jgi:hypothetical protein